MWPIFRRNHSQVYPHMRAKFGHDRSSSLAAYTDRHTDRQNLYYIDIDMCMSEFEQYVNYVTCRKTFKLIRVQYSSNVSQKFISAFMQNYILPSKFHDLLC